MHYKIKLTDEGEDILRMLDDEADDLCGVAEQTVAILYAAVNRPERLTARSREAVVKHLVLGIVWEDHTPEEVQTVIDRTKQMIAWGWISIERIP